MYPKTNKNTIHRISDRGIVDNESSLSFLLTNLPIQERMTCGKSTA